jgi:hypothetical protein
MFKEIRVNATSSENDSKHINSIFGQNAMVPNIRAVDVYTYYWSLKG